MIFVINWNSFIQRTSNQNIYVHEKDDRWDCYAVMSSAETMKSTVMKSDQVEQNMMFVDRHFSNNPNVLKIIAIENKTPNIIIQPSASVEVENDQTSYDPESLPMLGLGEIPADDKRTEE